MVRSFMLAEHDSGRDWKAMSGRSTNRSAQVHIDSEADIAASAAQRRTDLKWYGRKNRIGAFAAADGAAN